MDFSKKEEKSIWELIPLQRGFKEIEWIFENIKGMGYICGGYARYCASQRKQPVNGDDVDIFPIDEISYETIRHWLEKTEKFEVRFENDISVTYKLSKNKKWRNTPKIQLIKPFNNGRVITYGNPKIILANFDFTVVRACIVSKNTVLVDGQFVEDDTKGILRLKYIHCPISSLMRCMKYAKKGYFIRPSEAIKLFADWDSRDDGYRIKMLDFFKSDKHTEQEIQELEVLLRID